MTQDGGILAIAKILGSKKIPPISLMIIVAGVVATQVVPPEHVRQVAVVGSVGFTMLFMYLLFDKGLPLVPSRQRASVVTVSLAVCSLLLVVQARAAYELLSAMLDDSPPAVQVKPDAREPVEATADDTSPVDTSYSVAAALSNDAPPETPLDSVSEDDTSDSDEEGQGWPNPRGDRPYHFVGNALRHPWSEVAHPAPVTGLATYFQVADALDGFGIAVYDDGPYSRLDIEQETANAIQARWGSDTLRAVVHFAEQMVLAPSGYRSEYPGIESSAKATACWILAGNSGRPADTLRGLTCAVTDMLRSDDQMGAVLHGVEGGIICASSPILFDGRDFAFGCDRQCFSPSRLAEELANSIRRYMSVPFNPWDESVKKSLVEIPLIGSELATLGSSCLWPGRDDGYVVSPAYLYREDSKVEMAREEWDYKYRYGYDADLIQRMRTLLR